MKVLDRASSEIGPQRRKINGMRLHCCCVCLRLDFWRSGWSHYSSLKEEDEGHPVPKFCSEECRAKAGPRAEKITDEMKLAAEGKEWREPIFAYREATDREKYNHAARSQHNRRESPQ